ncbi:hypothetical protein K493DRAFT_372167, partial [Basidiobolus meristosporus CBS 931.73]
YFCQKPGVKIKCTDGFYCPENTFQPSFCCPGYYCSANTTVIKLCEEGMFCLAGSTKPLSCTLGYCPAGSFTIRKYNIFLIFLILLLVAAMFFAFRARRLRYKQLKYAMRIEGIQKTKKPFMERSSTLSRVKKRFEIKFEDIGLRLPNGVEIMKGVSGELRPGRTCAIMGPSGAGKTTFISLLTGKVRKTSGEIRINGKIEDLSKYRRLTGFVPQDDIMLRKLTVQSILMHSARMRLPVEWTTATKKHKVLEVIDYLGLGHIMNSIIGDEEERGVSGGQRKRVNIGAELVAEPSILFLDEPTSGLDSSTSMEICTLLSRIAHYQGLTVAAIIHSPSPVAFAKFDDLMLLGKGGRLIYLGPREEAAEYFYSIGFECPSDASPADFYMDVASGKVPCKLNPNFHPCDLFELWERKKSGKLQGYRLTIGYEDLMLEKNKTQESNKESKFMQTMRSIKHGTVSLLNDTYYWFHSVFVELLMTFVSVYRYVTCHSDEIRNTPGPFQVFWLCLQRACHQVIRSKSEFFVDQLLHLGAGLFISIAAQKAVYLGPLPEEVCAYAPLPLQQRCSLPYSDMVRNIGSFVAWGIGFAGIASGAGTFGNERVVFWRETASGMPTLPYFLAKAISDIPRIILAALMFTLAFIINYANNTSIWRLYVITLSLYFVGFSTGYFISALVKKEQAALVGVVVALVWAIAFSGVEPSLNKVYEDYPASIRWIWDISAPRWAISAFYIAETDARSYFRIESGRNYYGYVNDRYWTDIRNVFFIAFGYQALAFFAMKLSHRDKQT